MNKPVANGTSALVAT